LKRQAWDKIYNPQAVMLGGIVMPSFRQWKPFFIALAAAIVLESWYAK